MQQITARSTRGSYTLLHTNNTFKADCSCHDRNMPTDCQSTFMIMMLDSQLRKVHTPPPRLLRTPSISTLDIRRVVISSFIFHGGQAGRQAGRAYHAVTICMERSLVGKHLGTEQLGCTSLTWAAGCLVQQLPSFSGRGLEVERALASRHVRLAAISGQRSVGSFLGKPSFGSVPAKAK